jgi:hypothetical protein
MKIFKDDIQKNFWTFLFYKNVNTKKKKRIDFIFYRILILVSLFSFTMIDANSTVYALGTGTVDKFGIKQIYPTKAGGEQWFMNMSNPMLDARTHAPSLTKNSDGSWKVKSTQIRYEVLTSSGYKPSQITSLDEEMLLSKGYMQSPNDWKNVEMTGIVKFNKGDSKDHWTWYARSAKHTTSIPCEGASYKVDLDYNGEKVKIAKEQWHVSYVFSNTNSTLVSKPVLGKFIGFKAIMYNFKLNNKTAVKLEIWLDQNLNNNWQKAYSFTDSGGFGSSGKKCGGSPDQIITWGGPIATFRWDNAKDMDIKNFSVREIDPSI